MKHAGRTCFLALSACALFALHAGAARADAGDYVLRDGKVFRADGGTEQPIEDAEIGGVDTAAGRWAWFAADPGASGATAGSAGGLYFFRGGTGRPAGFVPIAEEPGSCRPTFSPSGRMLLISCGTNFIRHLELHHIDKDRGFVKKASFSAADPPRWIDDRRFVFTAVAPDKGARAEGRFDLWWCSVALYDTEKEELTLLREASATRNYAVADHDGGSGALEIVESSVGDAKDWADEDRIEERPLTLPLPAAAK